MPISSFVAISADSPSATDCPGARCAIGGVLAARRGAVLVVRGSLDLDAVSYEHLVGPVDAMNFDSRIADCRADEAQILTQLACCSSPMATTPLFLASISRLGFLISSQPTDL